MHTLEVTPPKQGVINGIVSKPKGRQKQGEQRRDVSGYLLVLFKAQLGEPFLEILIFFIIFAFSSFSSFPAKPALKAPKPALKRAKPALKRPNRHSKRKKI